MVILDHTNLEKSTRALEEVSAMIYLRGESVYALKCALIYIPSEMQDKNVRSPQSS